MEPIRLGESEQDMGVCVVVTCPHCQNMSRFRLRQRSASVSVVGFPVVDFGGVYELACSQCKFSKAIETGELPAVQAAQAFYRQLETREIDAGQYVQAVAALNCPSIHSLRMESATWTCPACNEQVPETLNECWQCSAIRPGLPEAPPGQEGELPQLPNAITRPPNPWEW